MTLYLNEKKKQKRKLIYEYKNNTTDGSIVWFECIQRASEGNWSANAISCWISKQNQCLKKSNWYNIYTGITHTHTHTQTHLFIHIKRFKIKRDTIHCEHYTFLQTGIIARENLLQIERCVRETISFQLFLFLDLSN